MISFHAVVDSWRKKGMGCYGINCDSAFMDWQTLPGWLEVLIRIDENILDSRK